MCDSDPELSVVVRIDNHDAVAAVYGALAIEEMHDAIRRRLAALSGVSCAVAANDSRHVRVDFCDLATIHGRRSAPLDAQAAVELVLFSIVSIHLAFDDEVILIAPSIATVARRRDTAISDGPVGDTPFAAPPPSPEWRRQYREDMRDAAAIFAAIEDERIELAWQPVRHAANPDDILYHECLVRAVDARGEPLAPSDFVPALERLGLVRAFDRYMVESVVEELGAAPAGTLAVNISALSAIDDGWWHGLKSSFRRVPDIAGRLVVEITETAEISSIGEAIAFVAEMRKLGCAIALDDFGMGHNNLRRLIALRPDVVKIDAFYIGWAERAPDGRRGIAHMVGLLGAVAPIVVAEGVTTQDQSDLIRDAGAVWQQGYHHGEPTVIRPSRYGAGTASGAIASIRTRWCACGHHERTVGTDC